MRVNQAFQQALQRLVQAEQGVTRVPRNTSNPVDAQAMDSILANLSDREKALLAVLVMRARNKEAPDLPVDIAVIPKSALSGADVARGSQAPLAKGPLHQNLQPFQLLLETGRFKALASGLLASMSYAADAGNRALVLDLIAQIKAALMTLHPDAREHVQQNAWPDIERRISGILSGIS